VRFDAEVKSLLGHQALWCSSALEQGADKPVGERIAYVCQDCGYVYDQETPFEDVPDAYNCPRQPLARFTSSSLTKLQLFELVP
jgi:hypothetical protein